jgi:hypothetical protein
MVSRASNPHRRVGGGRASLGLSSAVVALGPCPYAHVYTCMPPRPSSQRSSCAQGYTVCRPGRALTLPPPSLLSYARMRLDLAKHVPWATQARRVVKGFWGLLEEEVLVNAQRGTKYLLLKNLLQEKAWVMIKTAAPLEEEPPEGSAGAGILGRRGRVVVKMIRKDWLDSTERPEGTEDPMNELATMIMLSEPGHPSVVRLLDYFQDSNFLYIVIPYYDGGDLFKKISDGTSMGLRGLSEPEACSYLIQIVSGLLYLKSRRVAHRCVSLLLSIGPACDGQEA